MRTKSQSIFFALTASAAASLCIAATASPAAARGPADPLVTSPAAKTVDANKKVCMKAEPITGSNIERKVCKTRAQWEADGYTVERKGKMAKRG